MRHQRAGNSHVLELHGTGETASCLGCEKQFDRLTVENFLEKVLVPRCPSCNGLIKPNVVLFSEPLPADVFEESKRVIMESDLLIVVGSSLSVYPAAALPSMVSFKKTPVIIVNEEPTHLDASADVVIHGKAGEIFPRIIKALHAADKANQ